MKSYASICSFEGNYARLEVEMHDVEESKTLTSREKEIRMIDVKLDAFPETLEEFYEGDIVIVEHDMEFVTKILSKDNEEKQRRVEMLKLIKKRMAMRNKKG